MTHSVLFLLPGLVVSCSHILLLSLLPPDGGSAFGGLLQDREDRLEPLAHLHAKARGAEWGGVGQRGAGWGSVGMNGARQDRAGWGSVGMGRGRIGPGGAVWD